MERTASIRTGQCRALVERDHDLRLLSEQAVAVTKGVPRVVVVTGEAGVGKTRLVADFVESLAEGWTLTNLRPGGTFDAAGPSTSGPALHVVDDIQSFDPTVIDAIAVACAPGSAPGLCVATYRLGSAPVGGATAAAVARLLRLPNALELRLPRLSVSGIAEMVGQMRGTQAAADGDFVAELHERTSGNPFFAEAVLASDGEEVPWTVTESVLASLAPLDDDARKLAELLALAGTALDDAALQELDVPEGCQQTLVDHGLAQSGADGVELRHALVGEAIDERLSSNERRAHHRSLAAAFEATGGDRLDLIARQWWAAGEIDRAAPAAVAAADGLSARRMYASAADLYVIALEAPPDDPLERAMLFERAAAAAANAGRNDEALAWATYADHVFRGTDEAWRASSVWLNPGLRFVRAPKPQTTELPAGSDARLLREAGDALAAGDTGVAISKARSAVSASDTGAKGWTVFDGLLLASSAGASSWAQAESMRRLSAARAESNASDAALALTALAGMQFSHGDVAESLITGRAALTEAMQEAESFIWTHVQFMLGAVLGLAGELDEACALADQIRRAGQPMFDLFADAVMSIVHFYRGDLDRALEDSERMGAAFGWPVPTVYLVAGMTGLAQIKLATGDAQGALVLFDRADKVRPEVIGTHLGDRLLYGALAAEQVADRVRLGETLRRALALARHTSGPANQAVADAVVAIDARHRGDQAGAYRGFEAAAVAWERAPRRVLAAHAWCDAARAAARRSDPASATRAAAKAEAVAGDLRSIRRRVTSVRRAISRIEPGSPSELAMLTPRELDVARLLAEGKTNQQIATELYVSEKTVRNALTFLFAKLGVSRRTEAMALLHRVGVAPR